jgi:hypothetical protein
VWTFGQKISLAPDGKRNPQPFSPFSKTQKPKPMMTTTTTMMMMMMIIIIIIIQKSE